MSYTKPPFNNINFNFTSGYQKPSFGNINFNFAPSYTQLANLRSVINVLQVYQNYTYTYVKECKSIVLGYGNSIQAIQLPCVYGGIRDLGSYICGNPEHVDLNGYISVISYKDELGSFIRPTIQNTLDINIFVRPTQTKYTDLVLAIKVSNSSYKDLGVYIRSFKGLEIPVDLGLNLNPVPPKDLNSYLNIIEIRDLLSNVVGEWWRGQRDLNSAIPTVSTRNYKSLKSVLHGWDELNLGGSIKSFSYYDLTSSLIGGMFNIINDLGSTILPINPENLISFIHGWDLINLKSNIKGVFGPGDLNSNVVPILPINLFSYIHGFKGLAVIKDLISIIIGTNTKDLSSNIGIIHPINLNSLIIATGSTKNLLSTIIPKMLRVSTVFKISLLESINLKSAINYTCWASNYSDLSSNLYVLSKKDLKSYIIGWYGGTSDNVRDLKSYINIDNYINQDKLTIKFVPVRSSDYISLDVIYNNQHYHNVDHLDIFLTTMRILDLNSYIYGQMRSTNLRSYLNVVVPNNFTTLPDWIKPKTTEVFINLNRFEERWRRFVDLMFESIGDDKMHYFYVDGEKKVYKVDRNRKWVLWVTGYTKTGDSIIEKTAVRKKILFNLSKYDNIDIAVRDVMTLAAEFKTCELSSYINCVLPPHNDLSSFIDVKYYNKWYKYLASNLRVNKTSNNDLNSIINLS